VAPRIGMSRKQKLWSAVGIAAVLGGILWLSSGTSQAGESCAGLDTALRNNLNFIEGQRNNPDAQSDARIANRKAVVDLIQQRRRAAGCNGNVAADPAMGVAKVSGENCAGLDTALRNNLNFIEGQRRNPDAQSGARIANRKAVVDLIQQRRRAAGCTANITPDQPGTGVQPPAAQPPAAQPPAAKPPAAKPPAAAPPVGGAQQVCAGSTVTLSGEDGEEAASSGEFPIGTRLRVTNLDNNQSIEVTVTSTSGSCVLLNNKAFARIHEPNKQVIRRALIERIG
jgi:hypothetical protein